VFTVRLPWLLNWPIGDAAKGLCGGMVFAVRDYFEAGLPPPPLDEPPANGSDLFRFLVGRLWRSFNLPSGPIKYFTWMTLPDQAVLARTLRDEVPLICADIDRGRLAPFGFNRYQSRNPLRMGDNHQVMAYGYRHDPGTGETILRVYDPNHGPCDDLTMVLRPGKSVEYSTGETVRGFFYTAYHRPRMRGRPLPDGKA
jgi:hypothetical protein